MIMYILFFPFFWTKLMMDWALAPFDQPTAKVIKFDRYYWRKL